MAGGTTPNLFIGPDFECVHVQCCRKCNQGRLTMLLGQLSKALWDLADGIYGSRWVRVEGLGRKMLD